MMMITHITDWRCARQRRLGALQRAGHPLLPLPRWCPPPLPRWCVHRPAVQVGKDKLTVRYNGPAQHDNDVGSIQVRARHRRVQPPLRCWPWLPCCLPALLARQSTPALAWVLVSALALGRVSCSQMPPLKQRVGCRALDPPPSPPRPPGWLPPPPPRAGQPPSPSQAAPLLL